MLTQIFVLFFIVASASGNCPQVCKSCSSMGIGPHSCDTCVANATWAETENGLICKCRPGYWGEDCTQRCSLLCYECDGDAELCTECTINAQKLNGRCQCKAGWGGPGCQYVLPDLHWHELCKDNLCSVPAAADGWFECVPNASKKQDGTCSCDYPWFGNICSQSLEQASSNHTARITHSVENWSYSSQIFICHPICAGSCSGPTASDCLSWAPNASMRNGFCVCDDMFTADDCSLPIYQFACGTRWSRGCSGPTNHDCVDCIMNAYMNEDHDCVWALYRDGDDWSVYLGACNPICNGCRGPNFEDCIFCVATAYMSETVWVCMEGYSDVDCGTWDGSCHPRCESDQCTGPSSSDCEVCVDHASWNIYGYCQCDPYWIGEACETYNGPCDLRCLGCYGPGNMHCTYCAAHASWQKIETIDHCICEQDWGPEGSCIGYVGMCSGRCLEGSRCNGPSNSDCLFCNYSAAFDHFHNCECIEDWIGENCEMYVGVCHPICFYCFGPYIGQCSQCVAHATKNPSSNYCECDPGWIGDECDEWVGQCHPTCGDCHGPESCDCDFCVPHAHWTTSKIWDCDELWGGADCQSFIGSCHPKCLEVEGCHGASAESCVMCNLHAHRDNLGFCVCDEQWGGADCQIYLGVCNDICDGCTGSEESDCKRCVAHAKMDDNVPGLCFCINFWTGSNCATYTGPCSSKCLSTSEQDCTDPGDSGCVSCNANAMLDPTGNEKCVCALGRGDEDCMTYIGACDPKCDGCTGPDASSCRECIQNAEEIKSECHCRPFYSGDDCSVYLGSCDLKCQGCNGPTAVDCVQCVEHANVSEDESCACVSGLWSGDDCSVFVGECHPACKVTISGGGTGPVDCFHELADGCIECVRNAFRDDHGMCRCFPSWIMEETDAAIVIADEFGQGNCEAYFGECWPTCATCDGPDHVDCLTCREHASPSSSGNGIQCVCDSDWSGSNWELFNGECDRHCRTCFGPGQHECLLCIDHAYESSQAPWTCPQYLRMFYGQPAGSDFKKEGSDFSTSDVQPTFNSLKSSTGIGLTVDEVNLAAWTLCFADRSQYDLIYAYDQDNNNEIDINEFVAMLNGEMPEYDANLEAYRAFDVLTQSPIQTISYMDIYYVHRIFEFGYSDDELLALLNEIDQNADEGIDYDEFLSIYKNQGLMTRACICEPDWEDNSGTCDSWNGPCPNACLNWSSERLTDCIECQPHAYRNEQGYCNCATDWDGDNCETYIGECDPRWFACTGPFNTQCDRCSPNATTTGQNTCECYADTFTGNRCQLYQGACHPICNGCYNREITLDPRGNGAEDCLACVVNAHMVQPDDDPTYCACDEHWSGDDCSTFDQNYCYPTCASCVGPGREQCVTCQEHAFRDDLGRCACDEGWEKHDCSQWAGPCDPKWEGCDGPSANDCIQCVENGGVPPSCACETDWRGVSCERWAGACHTNCYGCKGPFDTDCRTCVDHAYQNDLGQCVCEPTWGPEVGCNRPIPPCGLNCVSCHYDQNDQQATCILWQSGYFWTGSDEWEICGDNCRTCDGASDSCTGCYDGYYVFENSCQPCYKLCLTCESSGQADSCTSCEPGYTLEDGSDSQCICTEGYMDNLTLLCYPSCALTLSPDAYSICSIEQPTIEYRFDQDLDPSDPEFSSLLWPSLHNSRGAYFDGRSYLEWNAFHPYGTFFMELWFRPDGADKGMMIQFDFLGVPATGENKAINSKHDEWWWLYDSCTDFASEPTITWHSFAFRLAFGTAGEGLTAPEQVRLDRTVIYASSTILDHEFYMSPVDDGSFWFGSYRRSQLKNFQGFMYGFKYSAWNSDVYYNSCENQEIWCVPQIRGVLSWPASCGPNQYFIQNDSRGCYDWHATCEHGCEDDMPCVLPCHEDCLTCDGTGSDQWVTCYPGAQRTDPDSPTSCCTCSEGMVGQTKDCRHVCYDSSCEICTGPYPHDCLKCALHHELVYTADEDANFCQYCYDDDYKIPTCGPQDITGARLNQLESNEFYDTQMCQCNTGEWLNNGRCSRCPDGCADCAVSAVYEHADCLVCDEGFFSMNHICIKACPSGYYAEVDYFDGAQCIKQTTDSPIFEFIFNLQTEGFFQRRMSYTIEESSVTSFDGTYLLSPSPVTIYGGANQFAIDRDDPYPIDDRGFFFDGSRQFLTFDSEYIWTRFSAMMYWLKPHSRKGTLFSTSHSDNEREEYHAEIIEGGKLGYVNSQYLQHVFENSVVQLFDWQYISFEGLQYESMVSANEARMDVYINEVLTDSTVLKDVPIAGDHWAYYGALMRMGNCENNFKGFLWKISQDYATQTGMIVDGSGCVGVCTLCPSESGDTPQCLGFCDFDYYWGEGRCEHCAYWCSAGCQSDGSC